jgi:hypothetical protein
MVMKNIALLLFTILLIFNDKNQAQPYTTEAEVLSAGGISSISGNFSNFGIIGETIVNDETTANNLSNYCGFIYAVGFDLELTIDLHAFLEGPFTGSNMFPFLNFFNLIPLSQPYNTSPWNYSGSESVAAIPNTNVVDWVLIELRDAPDAVSATSSTIIDRQAAFVLRDGTIVGLDGTSNLRFYNSISQQLFVVVYHRNHLKIMSANPLIKTEGIYSYDFTDNMNKAFAGINAQKEIGDNIWGLISGDANSNGQIDNLDKNDYWINQNNNYNTYIESDFSMDGDVNNEDKTIWEINAGKSTQVPD